MLSLVNLLEPFGSSIEMGQILICGTSETGLYAGF